MTHRKRLVCVAAVLLGVPTVAFSIALTVEIVRYNCAVGPQEKLEADCMADAEVAVGEYLRAHQPAAQAEFKSISGEGVHGPTPFSPVGFFIQEDGTVQYANRSEQIRICIFPRHITQSDKVFVYLVQGNDYLVAHPRLKGRPTIWGFDFFLPADRKWATRQYEKRLVSLDDTQTKVHKLQSALNDYKLHTGQYPYNLQVLFLKPIGVDDWEGRSIYGKTVPIDPWNHDYKLAVPGKHHSDSFDVWSMGPDGIDGTSDDIGNW
jgi:type II secretion system protein G